MHPVFLDLARRDRRQAHVAEELQQVQAQPNFVTLHPALAAVALGNDLVLFQELVGGLAERSFHSPAAPPAPSREAQ